MDPMTAIGVAANLARVIIHLAYTYKLQKTHVGILVDRITALEKPLETLERMGKAGANKISESALRKLVTTLEDVQKIVMEHQKMDKTSKTKRFLFGDGNMDDLKLLRERLDSCLLDLQLAITVEEVGNSEKRVHSTARATVDILLSSVTARASEAILKCVQCNQEYRQSENPIGACKYHTAYPHFRSWKHSVACCGKEFKSDEQTWGPESDGCARGVHCDFHHTQYPYTSYFLWMRHQVYNNLKESWLKVTDWDFEDGVEKYVDFGISNDNLLYVVLGKVGVPLFLQYFDPNNMPTVNASIGDMMTIALRGSDMCPGEHEPERETKWIVDALWTLDSDSKINGIRLSANSMSSKIPIVKEMSLSFDPLVKGAVRVLSVSTVPNRGSFDGPLPECTSNFIPFPDSIFQPPPLEPNYETVVNGNLTVRLKKTIPIDANPNTSGHAHDTFVLEMLVMNLSQTASLGSSSEERMVVLGMLKDGKMEVEQAIKLLSTLDSSPHNHGSLTFIDTRCRFYVNDRWVNANDVVVKLKKDDKMIPALPFEVAPRAAQKITVECAITVPEKKNAGGGWFHRAYITRLTPITVEVTFEEMAGATCSIMAQFGNPPAFFHTPPTEDYLFWIYCDDVDSWERNHITIMQASSNFPDACFEIHVQNTRKQPINFRNLLEWGYDAVKQGTPIFEIKESWGSDSYTIFALVDLSTMVTVGFKLRVRAGKSSFNEGIWMIPEDLFLASRKACIGEDIEKALWKEAAEAKPAVPSPTVAKLGSRANAPRVGTREGPPPPSPQAPTSTPTSRPAPPSTPLPPTPTSAPPTAQPPTSPPVVSPPPSAQPPTSPPTANGASNGTPRIGKPAPPPRQLSGSNGVAKPPATSAPSSNSLAPTPTPARSPSPSPAPAPAPAPAPSPSPSAAYPASASPSISATPFYSPPPLNTSTSSASSATFTGPQKGEVAMRCTGPSCAFGNLKDQCIKCKSNVPPLPIPPPGLLCNFCKGPQKGKCYTCNTVLHATSKNAPAILCSKCSFGVAKDKCIKCNKIVA